VKARRGRASRGERGRPARLTERDIVGAAFDAASRDEFRRHVLEELTAAIGCDAAYILNPEEPVDGRAVLGLPPGKVEEVRRDNLRLIPHDLFGPMFAVIAREGAAVDVDVLGERRRRQMPLHDEYLVPFGIRASLCAVLVEPSTKRQRPLTLMRTGRTPFSKSAVAALGRLAPVIALGDAAFGAAPARAAAAACAIVPANVEMTLTERQREICAHVQAGLTNAEIARACGISLHTVRNHLVTLFRQFDALSRTELAMRLPRL
jgi:DNA-binding CsgD family transcriptional regulator